MGMAAFDPDSLNQSNPVNPDYFYPCPPDFQTTVVMDGGTWDNVRGSRFWPIAGALTTPPFYDWSVEHDFGGPQTIPAGAVRNFYGLTFVTPQVAAQTTGAITMRLIVSAKAETGVPASVDTRIYVAMYQWLASDALGTVYTNVKGSPLLSTSWSVKTIDQAIGGGITLGIGDRLCFDVWLHAENKIGSGVSGRLATIRWGFIDFASPAHAKLQLIGDTIEPMRGVLTTSPRQWGHL